MTCEHLRSLEQAMIAGGMRETFRGQAWSNDCREWVYFQCLLTWTPFANTSLSLLVSVCTHIAARTMAAREALSVPSATMPSWVFTSLKMESRSSEGEQRSVQPSF